MSDRAVGGGPGAGPQETSTRDTLLIAGGAAATAVAAVAAMCASGLMPARAAVLAALLSVIAVAAPVRWPSGRAAQHRRRLAAPFGVGIALASGVFLVLRLRAAGTDPEMLVDSIGATMSWTLAALVALQLATAVTLRHVGVSLVGSLLAAVMCFAAAADEKFDLVSGLGLWLLVGWTTGIVTLWLLHRANDRLAVPNVMPGGRRPPLREPALLVVCSLVTGLLAVAVLPELDGLRLSSAARAPALSDASGGSRVGFPRQADGRPAGRTPQSYLSGSMSLNARGDLPDTELVEVPGDSPALWRASELSNYTGSGWETWGPTRVASLPRDVNGEYDLRDPTTAESLSSEQTGRADGVRPLDDAVVLPLLAPGEPVGVRIDGALAAYPGSMFVPVTAGGAYLVRSSGVITDPVSPVDVLLPDSLPARVRDLAIRLTRDALSVQAKVAAIESYLHAEMRYRLDSPVPDAREDAVDDFLFESKEGFCEHFAAAEVVLLRSVGVPARVVTGFAGGIRRGDVRVLRGSDAHAWVQVYGGEGTWFWSDPTAGSTLAEDRPGVGDLLRGLLDLLSAHAWLLTGLLLGLTLLGVAAVMVRRRVRARRAAARAAAAPLAVQVLAAFRALEAVLAPTSLARAPEASIRELQRTLARDWPGGLPDADRVAHALETVQRILYDAAGVPADRCEGAVAALATLTAQAADLVPTRRRQPVG